MEIEIMKYYGLTKELGKAEYYESDNYQNLLASMKLAIKNGGLIAVTGIVGSGKTTTLRRIQQELRQENKVLVVKALATDKRCVNINTLYTALFVDLATKKDEKIQLQAEKRERKLQSLIKERNKPVALFIDEAHDLHPRTLISLKHLVETVEDANGTLAIIAVGHPKLANDLRNPSLEEVGARAKLFELGSLGASSPKFIEWLINSCRAEKTKIEEILSKETIELLAERLVTPLQIIYYLTRVLEKGCQIGEKPISLETAMSVISPNIDSLEPNLARHGYNLSVLCDCLNLKRHEVKSYLRGQLSHSRFEEINKEIHKLGVLIG
jgi:type II secretory pathway predicted ATPase ExeA